MESKEYADELIDKLDERDVAIPTARDDGVPAVECDCQDHPGDDTLREGNRITALALRDDSAEDGWTIQNTCCTQCSIRDLYEKADPANVAAVIEGEITPVRSWDSDDLCINRAVVWDIHNPTVQ